MIELALKSASGDPRIFTNDTAGKHISESRFAVSNGFLGTINVRSSVASASLVAPTRTYVAGLFDTTGAVNVKTALIPAPDWLRVRISVAGRKLDLSRERLILDVERGVLLTDGRRHGGPGVHIRGLRLVSLHERSAGLQLIQMEMDDGGLEVTLEASVDISALELLPQRIEHDLGVWRTPHSGQSLAMAVAAALQIDGEELSPGTSGLLTWTWRWTTLPGQVIGFQRRVVIVRSDSPEVDPGSTARDVLVRQTGWRGVLEAHEATWADRWQKSDIELAGDATAQRALRFAAYHLNSAANPADERVSIGARALTGEGYHGHVFWDTDIFLVPFYVLTWPEAARALLMYRFHTLDGARAKAVRLGWRGAMYAWESAATGDEMTPEHLIGPDGETIAVLCGTQEQHISADIAYAVWHYWRTTGDDGFFLEAGAEILLETGRFWASRARPEPDGSCHIRGVIGPDENHEHIDDNAYTNVMARWNIRRALNAAALLRERWPEQWASLARRLSIDDGELRDWSQVAETIVIGFNPNTEMYEQFSGFFDLEDIDLLQYAGRTVPVEVLLGQERLQQSQIAKQADVVALLALLPDEFPGNAAERNFRYYEPRCSHRSSLSPAMHGLVAARLGDAEMALRFFHQTAVIDLGDAHGPADEGVHVAALGGIWMLAVFGFAGLSVRDDGLALEPRLPEGWQSLAFRAQWRGRTVHFSIDRRTNVVAATLETGEPMIVELNREPLEIHKDQKLSRFGTSFVPSPTRNDRGASTLQAPS